MNKVIEDYDVPPYLFQALNVIFAIVIIIVLYQLYKHFKGKK